MLDIRDCLEPAIKSSGMKKLVVAERAGLTQQQLCDVIAKRRKLDSNELMSICDAIKMTPNELVGYGTKAKEVG